MLNHTQFDDTQLSELDVAYENAYRPEAYRRSMISDRCLATDTARRFANGTIEARVEERPPTSGRERSGPMLFRKLYFRYEQLQLYDAFESFIPDPDPEPEWPEIAILVKERAKQNSLGTPMMMFLWNTIGRVPRGFLLQVARLRLARTALAIERYRLARGKPKRPRRPRANLPRRRPRRPRRRRTPTLPPQNHRLHPLQHPRRRHRRQRHPLDQRRRQKPHRRSRLHRNPLANPCPILFPSFFSFIFVPLWFE